MKTLKEYALMGTILFVAFAIVQFIVTSPVEAQTACRCNCADRYPSGVSFCNGYEVSCANYCSGKSTIIDWTGDFLSSVWKLYQIGAIGV